MINPNIGPKKAPKVSNRNSIPTWLKTGSQNIEIIKPNKIIINPELFKFNCLGKKFNKLF